MPILVEIHFPREHSAAARLRCPCFTLLLRTIPSLGSSTSGVCQPVSHLSRTEHARESPFHGLLDSKESLGKPYLARPTDSVLLKTCHDMYSIYRHITVSLQIVFYGRSTPSLLHKSLVPLVHCALSDWPTRFQKTFSLS